MNKPSGIVWLPLLIIVATLVVVGVVTYGVVQTKNENKSKNANTAANVVVNRSNRNANTITNVNATTNTNVATNVNVRLNANGTANVNTSTNANTNSSQGTNTNTSTAIQASLTRVGAVSTGEGSDPVDVALSGSYAYLADGINKKLQIINVSNPARPTIAGSYSDLSNVLGVDVVGNRLYVGDAPYGTSGLTILNIDQPTSPRKIGFFERIGPTRIYSQVRVVGDYAYLPAGPGGLEVISVSNPASPALVSSVDTEGRANDVAVVSQSGTLTAYVADSKVDNTPGRLYIIDVSRPGTPTVLGTVQTDGEPSRVFVDGTTAYLADGSGGLLVIDIRDPRNPSVVSTVENIGSVKAVVVSGTTAYASTASSIVAIDVSILSSPRVLATTPVANAFGLAFSDDLLYAASENGIGIFRLDR